MLLPPNESPTARINSQATAMIVRAIDFEAAKGTGVNRLAYPPRRIVTYIASKHIKIASAMRCCSIETLQKNNVLKHVHV